MIEFREEVAGFYKGYIYCSSFEEAGVILGELKPSLEKNIRPGLSAKVKRGCSEYSIAFPMYGEVDENKAQPMGYNKSWKKIEEKYDAEFPTSLIEVKESSLIGLNLEDVIIMQKWLDYARGLGDQTAALLKEGPVIYNDVYQLATKRLEKYPFPAS